MSDNKDFNQSCDPGPRRAEVSGATEASTQQPVQERSSAATQYWQGVAAAGRAARPTSLVSAQAVTPNRQHSMRT